MKPHVLYVCCAASRECEGWWSDLFYESHLLIWSLTCLICVLSVWESYEGWHALFKMNMSWVVMSPHFAIRLHFAWRICEAKIHSIQTEGVWGWMLSMQQLDALIPLRTMCGSRTDGWSLLGLMSDWQHCVDLFLAKYCRCRLRLDWCWCRWRTSAKGRCWRGLQVWRRQIGFIRGTRWPVESSAGRMVAKTARWSHGRFLGWASKPRSSRDYMGAESWVAIGGGYTEFVGFPMVHQKTTWFLGWSTKPRLKNWRWSCSSSRPVWPVCDDVVRRLRSGGHASGSQGLRRG
jgi:hypothetical protein